MSPFQRLDRKAARQARKNKGARLAKGAQLAAKDFVDFANYENAANFDNTDAAAAILKHGGFPISGSIVIRHFVVLSEPWSRRAVAADLSMILESRASLLSLLVVQ